MTSRDFCYWLQGFIELTYMSDNIVDPNISLRQMQKIKRSFRRKWFSSQEIDPSFKPTIQQALNETNNPMDNMKPHNEPGGPVMRC